MAGYSGTPLARKLGIKPGHTVGLLAAPPGFEHALEGLAEGARIIRDPKPAPGALDVIVLFSERESGLPRRFAAAVKQLQTAGGLWVAWPKRSSGVETDLTEDVVREMGLKTGLVDNKVCAIDDVWSGLRFVRRLKDRPKPAR